MRWKRDRDNIKALSEFVCMCCRWVSWFVNLFSKYFFFSLSFSLSYPSFSFQRQFTIKLRNIIKQLNLSLFVCFSLVQTILHSKTRRIPSFWVFQTALSLSLSLYFIVFSWFFRFVLLSLLLTYSIVFLMWLISELTTSQICNLILLEFILEDSLNYLKGERTNIW